MQLGTPFGAFLDPVADKVSFSLCCPPLSGMFTTKTISSQKMSYSQDPINCSNSFLQLMVAATLVLLCTKPLETSLLNDGPWLLTVPSIAIIGREVVTLPICIAASKAFSETIC